MKWIFNKQNLGVLLIALFFVNISSIASEDKLLKPVSTEIINVSWFKNDTLEINENYTYFDFAIDYKISNPNKNPRTFTLPYCNLAFLPNISIAFENDTLEYIPPYYIGLCMIGEVTVEPGITEELRICFLTIKEKDLENLPNGVYTLWIYLHSHPEIDSKETILTITDNQTIINTSTPPTLNLGIPALSLVIFTSLIIVIIGTISNKYKRKNH